MGGEEPIDKSVTPEGVSGGQSDLATTVYSCLRAIAQRQMQGERPMHTLTATALVHEAYLRLAPLPGGEWDRARFYRAAAEAMRHILIDHARRRGARKRGDRRRIMDIESVADLARQENLEDTLALDEAITRLESDDTSAAAVVRLRFYAGLTGEQVAELLGISPRQVDREWAYAKAFLLRALRPDGPDASA